MYSTVCYKVSVSKISDKPLDWSEWIYAEIGANITFIDTLKGKCSIMFMIWKFDPFPGFRTICWKTPQLISRIVGFAYEITKVGADVEYDRTKILASEKPMWDCLCQFKMGTLELWLWANNNLYVHVSVFEFFSKLLKPLSVASILNWQNGYNQNDESFNTVLVRKFMILNVLNAITDINFR